VDVVGWRDTEAPIEAQETKKASWRDTEVADLDVATAPEEISQLESGLRGAAQGITMEFADELEAKARSLMGEGEYDKLLPEVRDQYKEAAAQNPVTYYGADVASSFLIPVPGLGLASKAVKGATLGAKAGRASLTGAAGGAIVGAGASEGGDLQTVGYDAAFGAALGGVAAPALVGAAPLVGKVAKKVGDSSLFGRQVQEAYGLAKDTQTKFSKQVSEIQDKVKNRVISPKEASAEVKALVQPFGTRLRYQQDTEALRKQTSDIIEEMTSPKGEGPLGMVNRKYDQAKVIADTEAFALKTDDLIAKVNESVTDPEARKIVMGGLRNTLGVKSTANTFEDVAGELRSKLSEDMRKQVEKSKETLRKQSMKEAQATVKNVGKDAEAIYKKQLEAKFETDKRRFLNKKANEIRAANRSGEQVVDVTDEITKLEQELNSNFQINKIKDDATGKAVFEYQTRIGDPETGFTLANSVSTKSNFDSFAKLDGKEKAKASMDLANELYKERLAALNEITEAINYKMTDLGEGKFTMQADVPKTMDLFIPNKSVQGQITETQRLAKDQLSFDDIQTLRSQLNEAAEMATRSGNKVQLDEIRLAREALAQAQAGKLSVEGQQALDAANKFRRAINSSDARLLLQETLNPLKGIVDAGEQVLKKDKLRTDLSDDLIKSSTGATSSRSEDIKLAKKALEQMPEPEAKNLLGKIETAEKTAQTTELGKEIFDTRGLNFVDKLGFSAKGLGLAGAANLGRAAGSNFSRSAKMATLSPEGLNMLAEKAQSPMLKKYLSNMATADGPKRKAILFVLLQNSGTKQELDQLLGQED
jgi:hypothetical protein